MLKTRFIAVLALALMTSLAFAAHDQDFVKAATLSGMFEVKAGKMATEKGSDQIKTFGAQMLADHGTANDELKALAEKKGWTLPDALDAERQQTLDRLASLNQADFDKAYIEEMKKSHTKGREAFKNAAETSHDADLKAFAAKVLPVVERHLKHAEGISGTASVNVPPPTDPNAVTSTEPNRTYDTSVNRFQENQNEQTFNNVRSVGETTAIPTTYYTFENGEYVAIPADSPVLNGIVRTHECCCE